MEPSVPVHRKKRHFACAPKLKTVNCQMTVSVKVLSHSAIFLATCNPPGCIPCKTHAGDKPNVLSCHAEYAFSKYKI